ncbi:hypothetical protein [Legionella worsleiensis]|uniref:Substrate of the Dot/Icm secretion system n=1 Tax=Legionella worsleiensis TaxID=45076 RepID=A0A0W1AEJ3_9GAMM|nr:hypothetical protein [Legionella worsleiensis]KTD79756.1 substrate of the Dot/Icm secretion system [Legionella worsleiensis]STY32267.1 substrate of the Dot/Icm secretion system [Legionella worsleiensis]
MALSEIMIHDVLKFQLNKVICETSYGNLRHYLLERAPLSAVTEVIDSFLNEHYYHDKQTITQQLIHAACDAQKILDAEDASKDAQENERDNQLRIDYNEEFYTQKSKLAQLETAIPLQMNYKAQFESQVSEYKINLNQIEQALESIKQRRGIIQSRYHLNPGIPQPNVHAHPQMVVHGPVVHSVVMSIQDQVTLEQLALEEGRLTGERQRLNQLITLKKQDISREGQQLNTLQREKKQAEERVQYLMKELDDELPERAQQREIRHQERLAREHARQTDDPNLLQLAHKTKEELNKNIEAKIKQLDDLKAQLRQTVVAHGYSMFVTQLDEILRSDAFLKADYHERDALKSITSIMKNYLEINSQEQELIQRLDNVKNTLQQQQKNLVSKTAQLKDYGCSEPQLIEKNKTLTNQKIQLQGDSQSAALARDLMFGVSFVCGATALVGGVVFGTIVFAPLNIILVTALALVSLVTLTAGIVYNSKQTDADYQLKQNTLMIAANQSLLTKNGKEAEQLREHTIPKLKRSIEEARGTIPQLEAQIKQKSDAKQQLLVKAQNVRWGFSGGSLPFFNGVSAGHFEPVKPSAPPAPNSPEHEVEPFSLYPSISTGFSLRH